MNIRNFYPKTASSNLAIVTASTFVVLFANFRFLSNTLSAYPLTTSNVLFISSIVVLLLCVNTLLLSLACVRFTIKPVLTAFLLLSAFAAYFMDTYNVIIDDVMIDSIVRTDHAEITNLISLRQILYVVLIGLVPCYILWTTKLTLVPLKSALFSRLKLITLTVLVSISVLLAFGNSYATYFREHKLLRFYTNPTYLMYSLGLYANQFASTANEGEIAKIAPDARLQSGADSRKLILLVVGETVRADHMSLNGYSRDTNPNLRNENVINYPNVWSCGTSTAISVPCMFSHYTRDQYNQSKVQSTENVLDILQRTGVNVTWLDNNSDSKGVALRIPYKNVKTADSNSVCDDECRDVGLLSSVKEYVEAKSQGDIVIVLHQMGNHGPAYYRRYPPEFEQFKPACQTNILENCSIEEITNSYDNALLYTDYFLGETIELLKTYSEQFATAMVFISDHGESLGEYGLYLHGLPYSLAPDTQKHVPLVMWFDEKFKRENLDLDALRKASFLEYSHDNVFHTILGLVDVSTAFYDSSLDLTKIL